MRGRWTIMPVPSVAADAVFGLRVTEPTPVVPCDDAAIERVAQRLVELQSYPSGPLHIDRVTAAELLRAAGETP